MVVMARKKAPSGNIALMGFTSLINDASSEMITPILPILLTSMGANGFVIGLLGGVRESISSLLSIYFGRLSDLTGKRKPYVISGYMLSGVFKVALFIAAVFGSWLSAFSAASMERMGKAMRNAPRDALISESLDRKRLGRGFGLHRMMDSMGAILGSVLALALIYYMGMDFGAVVLVAAGLAFFSVVPLLFVKEMNISKCIGNGGKPGDGRLDKLVMILSLFALGNISYMFLIIRAQEFFPPDLSVIGPIGLYVLFNVFYTVLAIPFGKVADDMGKKKTLNLGYLMMFMTMAGFMFANSSLAFVLLFMLYGASYAIIETQQAAVVSEMASGGSKGAAIGKYYTGVGLGKLAGSTLAGIIWMAGPFYTFAYASLMTISGAVMLSRFNHSAKGA